MMVLHPAGNTDPVQPGRIAMQKPSFRRRRSKGTIAGFAFGKSDGAAGSSAENGADLTESVSGGTTNPAAPGSPNQQQHNPEANAIPSKPCHNARLALMCAHNAIRLGARAQLYLCPPGRARRELQAHLRQKARAGAPPAKYVMAAESTGGYYGLDKMIGSNSLEEYENQEEDFLISTNTFDVDSEEEASSGDEDDLADLDDMFSEEPMPLVEGAYANLREPLYTPVGAESSLSHPNGGPMGGGGSSVPGKLPFNRRKMRLFDSVAADDKKTARDYLQSELRRSKTRSSLLLARHLRRVQRDDLRRKREQEGQPIDDLLDSDGESPEEKALQSGVNQIPVSMSPALASALLIESLSASHVESIEGMAKCYDGIVNAGVALLEAQSIDPTKPPSANDKARATRSEVMGALAPLLVTSLEQPSGELILLLAKLRRMCGTKRYQRRFVQRIAPSLVRPPRGAMWCLRHQNDMEAILAACELIFDSSFDIFSKGWYERGRLMLADSKRAETLDTAAKQLRELSSEPADALARGLSSGPRRRLIAGAKMKQDSKGGSSEPLAEWEVIAVDREIRLAISHVLTNDWSKASIQQEPAKSLARRAGAISKRNPSAIPTSNSDMSPKAIPSSPSRSTASVLPLRAPHSPPHVHSAPPSTPPQPTPETMENVFGPAFASQNIASVDRSQSPPPSQPGSPPGPQRESPGEYLENKQEYVNNENQPLSMPPTHTPPPLSPRSPARDPSYNSEANIVRPTASPKREKQRPPDPSVGNAVEMIRPASPASSIGTSASVEMSSFKISGASSSGLVNSSSSTGTPSASQYRTLTSTAAERKRTVAACRALRAQIQRFEDAFVQLHGRPPKGAAERAPLATTYAQYREWKRAIRADAACRIQALLRGARTRLILLRSGDSEVAHVVLRRAGRPGSSPDLAMPTDIGGRTYSDHGIGTSSTADSGLGRPSNSSASSGYSGRPQIRRNSNGEDRAPDFGSVTTSLSGASSRPSMVAASPELAGLSLRELQARKRDLKQQLKQYDMNFARRHGRMPVKAEKEPIRHLYESYNSLKSQITFMEQGGTVVAPTPASAPPSQRTVSPPAVPDNMEDSPVRENGAAARNNNSNRRRISRAESPPVASVVSTTTSSSQDLAGLKAEKQQLHQMLRAYEKDFYKEHQRQVSSFADIRPVASQYRRYKEIKKAIAAFK